MGGKKLPTDPSGKLQGPSDPSTTAEQTVTQKSVWGESAIASMITFHLVFGSSTLKPFKKRFKKIKIKQKEPKLRKVYWGN